MEGSGWNERAHVNGARVTLGGGVEVQMSIYIGNNDLCVRYAGIATEMVRWYDRRKLGCVL